MKAMPTYCRECGCELPYWGMVCPDCQEHNARLNTEALAKRVSDKAKREIIAKVCAVTKEPNP